MKSFSPEAKILQMNRTIIIFNGFHTIFGKWLARNLCLQFSFPAVIDSISNVSLIDDWLNFRLSKIRWKEGRRQAMGEGYSLFIHLQSWCGLKMSEYFMITFNVHDTIRNFEQLFHNWSNWFPVLMDKFRRKWVKHK